MYRGESTEAPPMASPPITRKTIKEGKLQANPVPTAEIRNIRANALSLFARIERQEEKYDIIFLDPPYYKDMARKCLINIDSCDILAHPGLVIAEHFKKDSLDIDLKRLVLEKERRYGDTIISIYRRAKNG